MSEKKQQQPDGYEPTVSVTTIRPLPIHGDGRGEVRICVKDNGKGIPPKVLDKIFQPFFTTKPTGQGTGLGLSLSFDIIKSHGGELKVETKEGEGTEFIIPLAYLEMIMIKILALTVLLASTCHIAVAQTEYADSLKPYCRVQLNLLNGLASSYKSLKTKMPFRAPASTPLLVPTC